MRACHVDAVVRCLVPQPGGTVAFAPVSEGHTLHEYKHFLAATKVDAKLRDGHSCHGIGGYYSNVCSSWARTVMDGNCGLGVIPVNGLGCSDGHGTYMFHKEIQIQKNLKFDTNKMCRN